MGGDFAKPNLDNEFVQFVAKVRGIHPHDDILGTNRAMRVLRDHYPLEVGQARRVLFEAGVSMYLRGTFIHKDSKSLEVVTKCI